jgi:putative hydrolase of the HAD superfamily
MILTSNKIIVFDLDDTLYSERDFEKSGIEYIYNYLDVKNFSLDSILDNRENWIQKFIRDSKIQISFDFILDLYRNHTPNIELYKDSKLFLEELISKDFEISLITDGRSITQRNKLKALGLENFFKNIIISEEVNSEKPCQINFKLVMSRMVNADYIYIGDNTAKDFIAPNELGWETVCVLDRGYNIHKQIFTKNSLCSPKFVVKSFSEIILKK